MSALLLTAVVSTKRKTSVALTAHHLIAVVLLGQSSQGGLDHSSSHLEEHFNGGGLADSAGADRLYKAISITLSATITPPTVTVLKKSCILGIRALECHFMK